MIVTANQIQAIAEHCDRGTALEIEKALPEVIEKYEFDPLRLAYFLSQCAHESGGFSRLVENLNYDHERLIEVFPAHFNRKNSLKYAHHPEMIANHIYADRMGNRDEGSGDGWKYRGRGYIGLTGHDNYFAFSIASKINVIDEPDLVASPKIALWAAGWYWNNRRINAAADKDDLVKVTILVNGGKLGLTERGELLKTAKRVLK